MKIKHLISGLVAVGILVAAPAFAVDGTAPTAEEKKSTVTRQKTTPQHPDRHGVRRTYPPVYGCPEPGASCSVSCPNGNGAITCRVGEVCSCTCSGNYPQCSCD